MKCALFRLCSNISLCKAAVCHYLRAKHAELPPLLVSSFLGLLLVLIIGTLYLLYVLCQSCGCEESPVAEQDLPEPAQEKPVQSEGKLGGADGDVLPAPPPPVYRHKIQVTRCPKDRGGYFGGGSATRSKAKDDTTLCTQRLSKLLQVSQKCIAERQLQQHFRPMPIVPPERSRPATPTQRKATPIPKANKATQQAAPANTPGSSRPNSPLAGTAPPDHRSPVTTTAARDRSPPRVTFKSSRLDLTQHSALVKGQLTARGSGAWEPPRRKQCRPCSQRNRIGGRPPPPAVACPVEESVIIKVVDYLSRG